MYTLVLMAVLSSGGDSVNCHAPSFRGYAGNYYHWNGDGCDWYPSSGWYGGGTRGLNAWAAYAAYVNGPDAAISFGGNGLTTMYNYNYPTDFVRTPPLYPSPPIMWGGINGFPPPPPPVLISPQPVNGATAVPPVEEKDKK